MEDQTKEKRDATPELAETRPELLVNWEKERSKKVINTEQGQNRLKIFKESYKGIPYEIHVLYVKGYEEFKEAYDKGMWATLEQPTETKKLYKAIEDFLKNAGAYIRDDGFCYHDTAHSWNEGQDINIRIKEMREQAHDDIDTFYKYLEKAGLIMHGLKEIVNTIQEKDMQDTQ